MTESISPVDQFVIAFPGHSVLHFDDRQGICTQWLISVKDKSSFVSIVAYLCFDCKRTIPRNVSRLNLHSGKVYD